MIGFFDLMVDTTAKGAEIRDAFVVEHYKWGRTVSMNFWFPYFTGLLVDRFYDI